MTPFLTVLLLLVALAVLGVLAAGVVGVVRGGGDPRRSNALMRWRVLLQGVAIALIVLLLATRH